MLSNRILYWRKILAEQKKCDRGQFKYIRYKLLNNEQLVKSNSIIFWIIKCYSCQNIIFSQTDWRTWIVSASLDVTCDVFVDIKFLIIRHITVLSGSVEDITCNCEIMAAHWCVARFCGKMICRIWHKIW